MLFRSVLICGELMHRTNRETNAEEEGIQFFVREAYRLSEGISRFANGLYVDFVYEDPKLDEKMKAVAKLASANPGGVPMHKGSDVPRLQVGNQEGSLGTKGAFYPRSVAARARLSPPSTLPSPYL